MKQTLCALLAVLASTSLFSETASEGSPEPAPPTLKLEGKYTLMDDELEIEAKGKCVYGEWAEKGPIKSNCTWARAGETITLKLRDREEKAKIVIESRRGKKYIVLALKFLANGDAVGYTSEPLK